MRVSHFAKCETALKVIAKDGSKANGEVRGVRKRIAAAIALLAAILASVIAFWGGKQSVDPEGDVVLQTAQGPIISRIATPLTRQTIPGDRSRLENLPTNLFTHATEFFLAQYAEPGRKGKIRTMEMKMEKGNIPDFLRSPIRILSTDFTEHVDLKRIVTGMKREMAAYLAAGGTIEEYLAELDKRQQLEISYREKAEKRLNELIPRANVHLPSVTPKTPIPQSLIQSPQSHTQSPQSHTQTTQMLTQAYNFWLKANAQLKSMGIYELPLPDPLRDYQLSLDIEE